MKLTILLLTIALVHTYASGVAQNVTISGKNLTLKEVFTAIKKQTSYVFFYNREALEDTRPVSLTVVNLPVKDLLSMVFKDQPLDFIIQDKTISVSRKPIVAGPQQKGGDEMPVQVTPVSGRVISAQGELLPGVSVMNRNTRKSVVSAVDGSFSIEANTGDVLVCTSIGFEKQEVTIRSTAAFTVILNKSVSKLDEIQVMAYGKTTRRFGTGNITTITAEEISRQPVSNPLLALAGRVPGLTISQATGFSGSAVQVQIQGLNSISRGNLPFYVIDGVPYVSRILPTLSGEVLGSTPGYGGEYYYTGGNPLSFINAADIESIEVLKDADATAIYGSQAANGAILITTKKAKTGQTRMDVKAETGFGRVAKKLKLLNNEQFLALRREGFNTDGVPVPTDITPQAYDLTFWDQNRNEDWQKVLIGNNASYNDAQMNLSGGTHLLSFRAGAGYHRETTVFPTDLSDQKVSAHVNINSASVDQRLRFNFTGNYMVDNNHIPGYDLTWHAIGLAPNAPKLFDTNGDLNWEPTPAGISSFNNPLAYFMKINENKTTNLIATASLKYEILNGLDISATFGYNKIATDEFVGTPSTYYRPEVRGRITRFAQYGYNSVNAWNIDPQLTYNRMIGKGKLDVMLGTTFLQRESNRKLIEANGFSSDGVLRNPSAATTVTTPNTVAAMYKYHAVFARLNYNWDEKYVINLTARRDGTSRYGRNSRFHNFGAVGAAWLFSNEGFMRDHLSFLSFGKLKASYGTSGSDQIGDYQYMALYTFMAPEVLYSGGLGLQPLNLPDPYLHWENVRKLSASIDLGFFGDRLLLNVTFFRNRATDQIRYYSLPPSTGFSAIPTNVPATVENKGWELMLNATIVKTRDFSWSGSANMTIPKNTLIAYPGLAASSNAQVLQIGKPIGYVPLIQFAGVNPANGKYEYLDEHGNKVSEFVSTRPAYARKDPSQTLYGGMQHNFAYKSFGLDVAFQYVRQEGKSFYYGGGVPPAGGTTGNASVTLLQRWQKAGDITLIQRIFRSNPEYQNAWNYLRDSDAAWDGASFVRLRNVSLSWQLPAQWLKQALLQQARIYANCQNLFTFTKYDGLDPETRSSVTMPPLRVITFGIQLTL